MQPSLEIKWLQLIQVELGGTKYLVFNRILLLKDVFIYLISLDTLGSSWPVNGVVFKWQNENQYNLMMEDLYI